MHYLISYFPSLQQFPSVPQAIILCVTLYYVKKGEVKNLSKWDLTWMERPTYISRMSNASAFVLYYNLNEFLVAKLSSAKPDSQLGYIPLSKSGGLKLLVASNARRHRSLASKVKIKEKYLDLDDLIIFKLTEGSHFSLSQRKRKTWICERKRVGQRKHLYKNL